MFLDVLNIGSTVRSFRKSTFRNLMQTAYKKSSWSWVTRPFFRLFSAKSSLSSHFSAALQSGHSRIVLKRPARIGILNVFSISRERVSEKWPGPRQLFNEQNSRLLQFFFGVFKIKFINSPDTTHPNTFWKMIRTFFSKEIVKQESFLETKFFLQSGHLFSKNDSSLTKNDSRPNFFLQSGHLFSKNDSSLTKNDSRPNFFLQSGHLFSKNDSSTILDQIFFCSRLDRNHCTAAVAPTHNTLSISNFPLPGTTKYILWNTHQPFFSLQHLNVVCSGNNEPSKVLYSSPDFHAKNRPPASG